MNSRGWSIPSLQKTFRWDVLALLEAAAWGVIAMWAIYYLTWPLWIDQGILAWVADTIVHGGMPYQNAWEIRGPVALYAFAALDTVFGTHVWGFRLVDLLVALGGASLIHQAVARLCDRTAARMSALLYLLWYASFDFKATLQSDGWVAVLLAAAAVAVLHGKSRPRRAVFIAGTLVSLCALVKPQYGIALLIPMVFVIDRARSNARAAVQLLISVGAGFVLPIVMMVAWMGRTVELSTI